jgi:hypothetical protein
LRLEYEELEKRMKKQDVVGGGAGSVTEGWIVSEWTNKDG